MTAFTRPPAVALDGFTIRITVSEAIPTPNVAIEFATNLLDASGLPVGRLAGDVTPELTQAQLIAFTAAARDLYARARVELLA